MSKRHFKRMSDKCCSVLGCNKLLKQEIVDRNPEADKCYKCHMKFVRLNPKTGMSPMQREKLGLL